MKIYLVRHGETNWNKLRKIQGQSDIPLNEFGVHLAEETREGLMDIPFDICYSSPLIRAYDTARIILRDRDVDIIKDKRIEEMSFGEYEGLCVISSEENKPPKGFEKFFNDTENFVPAKGGESFVEIRRRTGEFITELINDDSLKDSNILITTHGAALAAIISGMRKEPISKFWGSGVSVNCGVTEVEVEDKEPKIICENTVYYDDEIKPWNTDDGGNNVKR